MDIFILFFISFILLLYCSIKGIYMGYALIISLLIFAILLNRKGMKWTSILKLVYDGGRKSFTVLKIFILIGAITAIWISSGTVPAIVYYGIALLNGKLFILSVFLISSFVSVLIGTSFGTIGTVGVALMAIARSGGVNLPATAGAILAGAYFGDRCSPMSSSANLIAGLTETNIYKNIRNMIVTSIIPIVITIAIYIIISYENPLINKSNGISAEILRYYNIDFVVWIPALIILVLAVFKIDVKLLMAVSIFIAVLISIFIQKFSLLNVIQFLFWGFNLHRDDMLDNIIKGGGIYSMLKIAFIVFISSGFSGVFEAIGIDEITHKYFLKVKSSQGAFLGVLLLSVLSSAYGCTQAIAIIVTHMLSDKSYKELKLDKEQLAVDIENSAVVIAPLIPWNIAVMVPLVTLNVGKSSIFYAVYLYLIPIINFVIKGVNKLQKEK